MSQKKKKKNTQDVEKGKKKTKEEAEKYDKELKKESFEKAHPTAALFAEDLKNRWWGNKAESSYNFWFALRHLNPTSLRFLLLQKKAFSYSDLCLVLPDFETVPEADWEEYKKKVELNKFPKTKSPEEFWVKYKEGVLRTLALDLVIVQGSATVSDSAFSIVKGPAEQRCGGASATGMSRMAFFCVNQDITNHFKRSARLRHGFPSVCPLSGKPATDEDDEVSEMDCDYSPPTYDESMELFAQQQ